MIPSRNGANHDSDDAQPVHAEVSIYTDDPVRVYLREMGAVPLLTRKGEVDLARRMERGKNQVYRALSRSRLIVTRILSFYDRIKKGDIEVDSVSIIGDFEEEPHSGLASASRFVRSSPRFPVSAAKPRRWATNSGERRNATFMCCGG